MFYVYAYIREKDSTAAPAGTPYYIGKGKGNRATDRHIGIQLPVNRRNIVYLEKNLTNVGALALERFYIRWYGRLDLNTGILRNRTAGGDGSYDASPSMETRQKIGDRLRGIRKPPRTAEHARKISIAKKGTTQSVEHRKKNSEANLGRILSNETKVKMSLSKIGKESPLKGMKKEILICPYCNKTGGKGAMQRWHFTQCKQRI